MLTSCIVVANEDEMGMPDTVWFICFDMNVLR